MNLFQHSKICLGGILVFTKYSVPIASILHLSSLRMQCNTRVVFDSLFTLSMSCLMKFSPTTTNTSSSIKLWMWKETRVEMNINAKQLISIMTLIFCLKKLSKFFFCCLEMMNIGLYFCCKRNSRIIGLCLSI